MGCTECCERAKSSVFGVNDGPVGKAPKRVIFGLVRMTSEKESKLAPIPPMSNHIRGLVMLSTINEKALYV